MNIHKAVDAAYEGKSLKEIADAPADAIAGVSAADAAKLKEAFGIKTVRDLGTNKYFEIARAIALLADQEA